MDHLHPTMAQTIAPSVPPQGCSLNDDDIYVINRRTRTVVQEYGCSSAIAWAARINGLPIRPGHALVTGMAARILGLVS